MAAEKWILHGVDKMIAFRIENTDKFVILPVISNELYLSYLESFPSERSKFKDHGSEYIINVKVVTEKNAENQDTQEESEFELIFSNEIAESDLHDFGVCIHIYDDLNIRLQELSEDAEFDLVQRINFQNMIKRVAPLSEIDAKKYLRKLSAYLDAFSMNFYEMKEVTDTRFTTELIFKNVTRSNLLLGNDVESQIYELLPF